MSKQLHISRDVIFEENKGQDWSTVSNSHDRPEFFIDEFQSTVAQPTTDEAPVSPQQADPEPASPPSAQRIPAFGSPHGSATPIGSSSQPSGTPRIQWATPPDDQDSDVDELTPRYRTLSNLFDTTEEVQNFEYSGLCLLAADEPANVEEALDDVVGKELWKQNLNQLKRTKLGCSLNYPKIKRPLG